MTDSILHIETRHRRGGAERNVNHFAAWQAARGHRVVLAMGRDSNPGEVKTPIEPVLIPSLVRAVRPLHDVRAVFDLRNLIRRERFAMVHTHQSKAGIVGRVAARRATRVVVHTVHMASFGSGYGRVNSQVFRRAEAACAVWTDEMIAVGEELRERYLTAGVGSPSRFRVIHSPIELDAFTAVRSWSGDIRATRREAIGAKGDEPLILVVSALEPRKRVDLILERLAVPLRSGWRLVVAGEGTQRPELATIVARLGLERAVTLIGHREDIPSLMGAADVLVHAAEAEGVPQVVIQALAAGLPIAATDVIGLREVPGAPIAIGSAEGRDLTDHVRGQLQAPPPPVPEAELAPWSRAEVEGKIGRLHQEMGIA